MNIFNFQYQAFLIALYESIHEILKDTSGKFLDPVINSIFFSSKIKSIFLKITHQRSSFS